MWIPPQEMQTAETLLSVRISAGTFLRGDVGESVVHILCMASIDHRNGVALDGVSVVPLVGVRHMVACPSTDGGTTTWQRPLYGVDSEEGIAHVALHVFVGIGVLVLHGHVPIETSYLGSRTLGVEILILHIPCRR